MLPSISLSLDIMLTHVPAGRLYTNAPQHPGGVWCPSRKFHMFGWPLIVWLQNCSIWVRWECLPTLQRVSWGVSWKIWCWELKAHLLYRRPSKERVIQRANGLKGKSGAIGKFESCLLALSPRTFELLINGNDPLCHPIKVFSIWPCCHSSEEQLDGGIHSWVSLPSDTLMSLNVFDIDGLLEGWHSKITWRFRAVPKSGETPLHLPPSFFDLSNLIWLRNYLLHNLMLHRLIGWKNIPSLSVISRG